jgi:hypothetical protein
MKKQLLATAVLAVLSLNVAYAYQAELNGYVGGASINDSPDDVSQLVTGVSMTGYLEPVSTRNGPLAEAGFINHASNATLSYDYNQYTQSGTDDIKFQTLGAGAEFYVPQSILYLSVFGAHTDANFHKGDENHYGAEIGILPIPNLLLTVGAAVVDDSVHNETDPTIRAKWLTQLYTGNSVNVEANARFGDHSNAYGVRGDLYLDRTFSVGAGYDAKTLKDSEDPYQLWNINARKFITPNVSVGASLISGKSYGADSFGGALNGTLRF